MSCLTLIFFASLRYVSFICGRSLKSFLPRIANRLMGMIKGNVLTVRIDAMEVQYIAIVLISLSDTINIFRRWGPVWFIW